MARDSELDLPAIKKLCEAASEEPWEAREPRNTRIGVYSGRDLLAVIAKEGADAEFIAQARTLVPQLVTALEEAQERVAYLFNSPNSLSERALQMETRCATLERQLAEAQVKLDAVDEWQEDWDGVGTIDWTALSRILKEEK